MPIGLPERERDADREARRSVGPRWASVFMTPPAAVLAAPDYAQANAIATDLLGGKRISQQAFALRRTIDIVNRIAAKDARLIEVHPEVSFRILAGEPVQFAKTTWNGQKLRARLLAEQGIELSDDLGEAGSVPVADVLDAAVAAWSARRWARGDAQSLPGAASPKDGGVIWY